MEITKSDPLAHTPIVASLKVLLYESSLMSEVLLASLSSAKKSAQARLNSDLYNAINDEFNQNGWPTTVEAYLDYLDMYVRLIPNEEKDPNYPEAWQSNDQRNGYSQKVYDLLCQFYWLIDQKVHISGEKYCMQTSFPAFAKWLVEFVDAWGEFLDTEESLNYDTLMSFKHDSMYNYDLYSDNSSSWKTFNEFFYREFNGADSQTGISPLRPIADPGNNTTIASPADCTYKQTFSIDSEGNVVDPDGLISRIKLKHTHSIGNINELMGGSEYASDFYGGTFVHYFLSPFDYHRFHTPVSGNVLEIKPLQGSVYLAVNLIGGQWDAPDSADDGYEFKQSRGLITINAGSTVGKVAVLPIGMAQVSSSMMYTDLLGTNVVKGQEFGKFRFGGSDIIMLFQKTPDLYLFKKDPSHVPIHFQYGQTAAYWNGSAQS